jgi:hypothetical protein
MKKAILVTLIALVGIVAAPNSAHAQFDLKKIGNLFSGSSTKKTSPYKTLAENAPAKSEITGVWTYSNFDLEYLGSNTIADAAIDQVEGFAREELKNGGITAGCFTITLNKSGKASFCYDKYIYEGSYTYDTSNARFVLNATADNGKSISCGGFLTMKYGKFVVMLNAEDAIKAFKTMLPGGEDDEMFVMIENLVANFPGIYISMYYSR